MGFPGTKAESILLLMGFIMDLCWGVAMGLALGLVLCWGVVQGLMASVAPGKRDAALTPVIAASSPTTLSKAPTGR